MSLNQLALGIKLFGATMLGSGLVSLVEMVLGPFQFKLRFILAAGSFVCLAVGIGVLELWEWARWLAIIGAGLSLASGALTLAVPTISSLPTPLQWVRVLAYQWDNWLLVRERVWLGFLWDSLALWYFLRPAVKMQFVSKEP